MNRFWQHILLGATMSAVMFVVADVNYASASSCLTVTHDLNLYTADSSVGGEVSKLQVFLVADGTIYPKPKVTGLFDTATQIAVASWQKAHNIPSSGFVDSKTRSALASCAPTKATSAPAVTPASVKVIPVKAVAAPAVVSAQVVAASVQTSPAVRTLSKGMSGTDVVALQKLLVARGLLSADAATGYFGSLTETAVKQFQAQNKLLRAGTPATTGFGAVGPKTRALLAVQDATPPRITPTPPVQPPPSIPVKTPTSTPTTPKTPAAPIPPPVVFSGGGGGGGGSGGGGTAPTTPVVTVAPVTFSKIMRILNQSNGVTGAGDRKIINESETMPAGYIQEASWLTPPSGTPGSAPLYRCGFGNGGVTLSKDKTCPGMTPIDTIGYIYTSAAPGRVALRRCSPGKFISDFTNCEGTAYTEEELVGYVYRTLPYDVPASVSPTTIARGDSLTISWQTLDVTEGHEGLVNKFPKRAIGLTLSPAGVTGAFIEEGQVTGNPKTNRFPTPYPITGTKVWKSNCDLTGWCGVIPSGQYQIQVVLFPACTMGIDPGAPCPQTLEDFLFTATNIFTIVDPTPPTGLAATCTDTGAASFSWSPTPAKPLGYPIRILDNATSAIVDYKDNPDGTSYTTTLTPGHTYSWWVHAQYESGESPYTVGPAPLTCQ